MTIQDATNTLLDLIAQELGLRSDHERRIIANRIIEEMWRYTVKQPEKPPEIVPMNDAEAAKFGKQRFVFGKYAGERFDDHLEYLAWLADTKREEWTELHRYLTNPKVKLKRNRQQDQTTRW